MCFLTVAHIICVENIVFYRLGKLVKRLSHDHEMDLTIQMVSKGDILATLDAQKRIEIFHLL